MASPDPSPDRHIPEQLHVLVVAGPTEARRIDEQLATAGLSAELHREGSIAAAEDACRQARFDLCLLDPRVPDGSGPGVVRRFRRSVADLPVVVLTRPDDGESISAAVEADAVEYLVRDGLTPPLLTRTIGSLLRRDRVRGERGAAEEKWFTVFEASPIPMVISDAETSRLIEVNDAFVEMFGQGRDEMLEATALELEHWDDPIRRRELIEEVKETGSLEAEEAWYRDDDGQRGRMLLSCRRLELSAGDRLLWTVQDVTERVERKRTLERRTEQLRERVKEQSCLYDVSRILHQAERSLAERLDDIVDRIPAGWQHPEVTVARLRLGDAVYATAGFEETAHQMETSLEVAEERAGDLTVGYLEERPEEDLGPFLEEERLLLEEIAGQVEVELSRQKTRRAMSHVVETMSEAVTIVAPDGTITFANSAARRLFEEGESGYLGEDLTEFAPRVTDAGGEPLPPEQLPFQRVMRTGEPVAGYQHAIERSNGERRFVSVNAVPMRDDEGEIQGVVLTVRDVTEQEARQRELEETTRRLHELLDAAAGLIFRVRLSDLAVTYVTPNVGEVTGFPVERWAEDPMFWRERVPEEDLQRMVRSGREAARRGEHQMEEEYRFRHEDGDLRWYRTVARFERDEQGEPVSFVGTAVDITERRKLERQLRHQALHDPLTGLANRILLNDRLEQAVGRSRRHSEGLAVMMADLDRFKRVNDSLGHTAGDRVLVEVARRLESAVRAEDTVARWGGDEFCVLLTGVEDRADLDEARERLHRRTRRPLHVMERELTMDVTLGAVLFGCPEVPESVAVEEPEELIQYADHALHRAKRQAGTSYHLHRPSGEGSPGPDQLEREQEMRRALAAGEFEPFYQPIVRLDTGEVWGVEPLARWRHPERGLVAPDEFIPLAEETGLIHELGREIMGRACRDVGGWTEAEAPEDLRLTLNVSGLQFEDEALVRQLEACLAETGLQARQVMLEVTETSIMRSTHRIEELRRLGIGVVIDDFGTGYSSMLYLRDLEVDGLKVDMSFVQGLGQGRGNSAIVETTMTLGREMGIAVIAEGIETDDQLERLRRMGCELGQGFRFARPKPADEMAGLLTAGPLLADDAREATG